MAPDPRGHDGTRRVRRCDRTRPLGVDPVVARSATRPARQPQCRDHRPRRRGVRPAGMLRIRHRHTRARRPGRRRPALHELPHHLVVLTHPRLCPDGPQPPLQRHGADRRARHRVPGLRLPHPEVQRPVVGGAARARLRHLGRGQVAPHPRRRVPRGRPPHTLAAGPGLRALLRLHGGRDAPVRPRPRGGQPPDPSATTPPGRLPPHRGPRRPRRRAREGPASGRPRQAVLPLLLPRRVPRPAPSPPALDRAVPGRVRRRLGRVAPRHAGPPAAVRCPASRHRVVPAPRLGAGVGLAVGRGPTPLRPLHGGVRGVPEPHRPLHRTPSRLSRGDRRPRQHHGGGAVGQRRELRGRSHGLGERRAPVEHGPAHRGGGPGPHRRDRRAAVPQQLPVGMDRGRQHPVQALEARDARGWRRRPAHRELAGEDPDPR